MKKILSLESPVTKWLTLFTNLVLLNTLFLLTSLPIVSIGAALTALATGCQRILRGNNEHIIQHYFKDFKENAQQSTYLWGFIVALTTLLIVDFLFFLRQGMVVRYIACLGLAMLCIVILLLLSVGFSYIGRYQDSFRQVLRNSLLLAMGNPLWMWCILGFAIIVAYGSVSSPERLLTSIYVNTFGGCAVIAFVNAYFVKQLFDKIEKR
ncbi:DUF624 domain-containing protein [Streptococcus cuniculi]|nr:DUF624 domain-containing protein [Streptococcus cuniculi]MBF0777998.1 DUF624 domain-containing protein [Streptococcus cuniculi]